MKPTKKTLPNGLRLITIPMKDSTAVAVYIFTETGSSNETKKLSGISHFLEHSCFKGTVKRPNAQQINREFDSIGAQVNAFTDQEVTAYYAKAHPKHVEKIFDVLSDMYLNSVFPAEDIEREKGVIIEEINMYEDLPQRKVGMLFDELLYGDTPAGRSVAGTKATVSAIMPKDFVAYRNAHYTPERTIVVVAGNFDPKKVGALVRNTFSSMKRGTKVNKGKVVEKQKSPALLVSTRESDQTHIVLGVRTFPIDDKRHYTLAVLNTILGASMSSRLFHRMREELGICYYIHSHMNDYTDHGSLNISAGVDKTRVVIAIEAIIAELQKLKTTRVDNAELAKAKEFSTSGLYLSLETSDALAGFYGMEEVLQRKLSTPKEIDKKIRAVTAQEVQKLAQQIFVDKNLNLAIVGRTPREAELKKVLHF